GGGAGGGVGGGGGGDARSGCRLTPRRSPPPWLGLFGRCRRRFRRRCTLRGPGVEIGHGMCQFRFGSRLLGQRLALSNVALSAFAPLIAARIAAFAIVLPIASAAAPAASSSWLVSAVFFAFAVGFRREASGVVVRWTFLPSRVLIFSVELIPQFDDWNVPDVVVLGLALHMLATAAPAPAAPTTPSRSALA